MALDLVYLAVATLLAPALAEMAKIRAKAEKAFTLVAVGGVLFVLAAAFAVVDFATVGVTGVSQALSMVFGIVGLIAVLVGALMASAGLLKE